MFWVRDKRGHPLDKSQNMVNNESMINIEYDSRIRTLIGGGAPQQADYTCVCGTKFKKYTLSIRHGT